MRRPEHDRRHLFPLSYRYFPHDLQGLVALLLFFVALVLGAGLAVILRALVGAG